MRKFFVPGILFLTLASCQVAEPRASLPPPLPDKVSAVPYSQLLTRARAQATRATEALFVDNFADVEEAGRGLEQTASTSSSPRTCRASTRTPSRPMAGDLGKLAKDLREAASSKNAEKANEILGKVNAKVRSMRLSD